MITHVQTGTRQRSWRGAWRAAATAIALAVAARGGAAQAARGGLVLALPTSVRALGLGGAADAAEPGEWAVFTAPGQLAGVGPAVGVATEAYLATTRLSAAAVAMKAFGGTVGFGATLLDYGSVDEIASAVPGVDGTATGRAYSAQDNAVVVGYARRAGALRMGGAVEFVNTRVADLSGSSVAVSASAGWAVRPGWDVTAGIGHAGADVALGATRGALPFTLSVSVAGPAWRVPAGWSVHPMAAFRDVRGEGASASGAMEAAWSDGGRGLALRAGYTWRGYADDHWPVSLGFGATLGRLGFDYAVERFSTIGQATHRVGLRYARGAPGQR